MSSSTKVIDPAFQGAGQKIGTEIWRIENFQPVPLPNSDHGKFYTGDSYIILQTSPGKGGAYLYDIHFWLGKDTSHDEAGTAAIKTVELDDCLGGKAVQHRELQGHESDKFLSYFKPCIIPLEGGVASGFKKPEEEEFETRLYICKGKRAVKVKQVPFSRSSLNHDDVFVLDTKDKIYQFNGATSNIQERAKALEVIQFLKDTYHEGKCDVAIVDDGKLQTESDSGEFWILFGGFAPIGRRVASEDDVIPEATPAKLYSVVDGQIDPLEGELSKGMLENNKCYLLDCGDEIYLWFGRVTQVEERKSACQAADDLLSGQNRPKATRVTRVIQGYESHSFKSYFDSWPAGSVSAGAEEGRGKVAAFLKQQGAGVKGATKGAPVSEEVPPLLAAGGKIEVWRINGSAKTSVPKEDIGKFYSGDCYIILYTYYHSGDKKEDYYLCWWIGKDSVEEEQKMVAQLAKTMSNSLKGRAVQGRIFQGKEPPQFLALFEPMVVLKRAPNSPHKDMLFNRKLTISNFTSSISSLSSSSPIIQNPLFRVFLQRASISSLKVVWRKDPKLDQAILNDRKWRLCTRVAREVLNEPNHSIPLRYLEKRRSRLKLNVKAKTFISQNPTLFETYLDRIKPKTELVSFVRPSDRLRRFMEEEKRIYELNEMLIVEKLCKLLMMSTDKVISNDKLVHVKREFGFPNDFLTNLVPRYPNYFRIVGRIEEEGKSWLELVSSEPEFAESVIMKRAVEEEKLTGIRIRPAFNWQLPPGFLIKKEMREWIRDWMEMPYISPYEDASNFDLASPEMEKRMVGVLHELLSMSLFKRIPVPILGKFGEEFRFSNQFANVFTRHSGIFYMSLKGGIKTAMLREAYKGEILIDRDPLLEIKDKFVELLDDGWRLRAEKLKLQREAAKKDMELMNSRNRDLELNKSDIEELENGECSSKI